MIDMLDEKRAIEAIVAPLVASEVRKNTLRLELWSHVLGLMEEEAARGGRAEAAERALARLGHADDIRLAFLLTIPKLEQWLYALDHWLRGKPGNQGRLTRRTLLWGMTFFCTVAIVILLVSLNPWVRPHSSSPMLLVLQVCAVASSWLTGWMVISALQYYPLEARLATQIDQRVRRRDLTFTCIRNVAWALCLACAVWGVSFLGLALTAGIQHTNTLLFCYIATPMLLFVLLTSTSTLYYAAFRNAQVDKPIQDWPYTQLS